MSPNAQHINQDSTPKVTEYKTKEKNTNRTNTVQIISHGRVSSWKRLDGICVPFLDLRGPQAVRCRNWETPHIAVGNLARLFGATIDFLHVASSWLPWVLESKAPRSQDPGWNSSTPGGAQMNTYNDLHESHFHYYIINIIVNHYHLYEYDHDYDYDSYWFHFDNQCIIWMIVLCISSCI